MTTTTSYSKKDRFFGLYKSTLKRSAGYCTMFSALIFIFYPLQYILEMVDGRKAMAIATTADPLSRFVNYFGFAENYTGVSAVFLTMLLSLAPLVFALLLNSYMQSHKASDVYHALPVTRGMMMTANAAAAMTMIAFPMIVSDIIIAVVQAANFGFSAWMLAALAVDTLGWLIMAFAVYALVAAVSTGTGTTFDTLIHSMTLLFALPALAGMFLLLAENYLYGWTMNPMSVFDIFMLSPVMVMPARMLLSDVPSDFMGSRMILHNNIAVWAYLLIGVGLLALGIWLYRRRHSEMAETTNSKGPLKNSVKFIGVMICGIMSGILFGMISGGQTGYIVWATIGGMMTYAIIEAILNRGFKTMIKSLPLGVLMTAICVGSGLVMMNGGLGYESRVPATNDVASVKLDYTGRFDSDIRIMNAYEVDGESYALRVDNVQLSDPTNIQAVTEFQRAAIAENENSREWSRYNRNMSVSVSYRLKNGKQMSRSYGVSYETMEKLIPIEVSPEFVEQTHPAFFTNGGQIAEWKFSDTFGTKEVTQRLSAAESDELLAAMRADISAQTLEELKNPKPGVYALISFTTIAQSPRVVGSLGYRTSDMDDLTDYSAGERYADNGSFMVSDKSQQTYKWLEAKGLIQEIDTLLDECVGVVAVATADPYVYGWGSKAVMTYTGQYDDSRAQKDSEYYGSLEETKANNAEDKKYRENDPDTYGADLRYFAGDMGAWGIDTSIPAVFEAPDDIKALGGAVVHTAVTGRTYISARFFFANGSGRSVIIDPQYLPQNVLDKFMMINHAMDSDSTDNDM